MQLDPEYQKFIDILKVKEQTIKKLQAELEEARKSHQCGYSTGSQQALNQKCDQRNSAPEQCNANVQLLTKVNALQENSIQTYKAQIRELEGIVKNQEQELQRFDQVRDQLRQQIQ